MARAGVSLDVWWMMTKPGRRSSKFGDGTHSPACPVRTGAGPQAARAIARHAANHANPDFIAGSVHYSWERIAIVMRETQVSRPFSSVRSICQTCVERPT